ncbi:MAG: phage holin family protein [Bacilli bacterium]|nr:phage holin family protein [Bacilli bacterium]
MNKNNINNIIECLIYIMGYALILNIVALIFKNTIQIDNSYYGIWGIIASTVIYVLNKTIKPIIVRFTIPITALTLGIFYPFINVIILKIVDLLLLSHFTINGIIFACLAAILISVLNIILDDKIIKPIIRKGDNK